MTVQSAKSLKKPRDVLLPLSWEGYQALSLGAAGVSLLVLLTTLQILAATPPDARKAYEGPVLWSLLAIAQWIALWKMGDTHAYWRAKSSTAGRLPSTRMWMELLFAMALATLLAAVGNLVHTFISWPLYCFVVAVVVLVCLLVIHNKILKRAAGVSTAPVRRLRKRL